MKEKSLGRDVAFGVSVEYEPRKVSRTFFFFGESILSFIYVYDVLDILKIYNECPAFRRTYVYYLFGILRL